MSKLNILISTIIATTFLSLSACANAESKQTEGVIILKADGGNKTSVSTHLTTMQDTLFCDGHIIKTNLERKFDFDGDNEFSTSDFSIEINGETPQSIKNVSISDEYRHFGVDFTCREDSIHIYLTGYNDIASDAGRAGLFEAEINKITGQVTLPSDTSNNTLED